MFLFRSINMSFYIAIGTYRPIINLFINYSIVYRPINNNISTEMHNNFHRDRDVIVAVLGSSGLVCFSRSW